MKKQYKLLCVVAMAVLLNGCAASTNSTVGVSCNYSLGKPFWDLPLDCQGR